MRPRVPLSTLCLLVAVIALTLSVFLLTARHNAQLLALTQRQNAQLAAQAERCGAQLAEQAARQNAQLTARTPEALEEPKRWSGKVLTPTPER